MKQKLLFSKLLLLIGLMFAGSGAVIAQVAAVGDVLWKEQFTGTNTSTNFSATSSWSSYVNPATLVDADKSSLIYSSSSAMLSSGSGANMSAAHVWLNKNSTGYWQVSDIKLYNASKVIVSWNQGGASILSVLYAFDGGTTYTELGNSSSAGENLTTGELTVEGHTTISLKFQRTSTKTNIRIDDLTLSVSAVVAASEYEITPSTNNSEWGTVSMVGTVITASPAEGYRVSTSNPYTVTSGSATVVQTDNTFRVNAESDCTVRINFEAIPSHTVSWSVNRVVTTTTVKEGEAVTFSTPTENIPEGYSFRGWYNAEILTAQETAPEYVTAATMGTDDMTYYAVFAQGSENTVWIKVNLSDVSEEGTYALLTTDGHAFNGHISSGHGQVTSSAFSFTNNQAAEAPEGTCELTLQAVDGGFKMYSSGNGYLYAADNSSGNLAWHSTESSYWLNKSNNWTYNSNSAYLRSYNNASFRTYASNSGSVLLMAKKSTVSTMTDFCTYIAPPTATISINAACTDGSGKYYGTFYTDRAYVMHEDLEGQVVSVDADGILTVQTAYSAGDVVPANTALLIFALEDGDYTVNLTSGDGIDWSSDNMLKGTLTADDVTEGEDCLFYRLTMYKGTQLGFWWGAENGGAFKPGANKAYLAVPTTNGVRMSGFWLNAESTGVEAVKSFDGEEKDAVYNLMGQRVALGSKGLVIKNGKKFINK